jgi:hypothetical protein
MGNSQSNVIFAYLLIAFIVFITVRGELPTYLGFLLGGTSSPVSQGGGGINAASIFGGVGNSTPTQLNLSQSNSNPAENAGKVLKFAKLFIGA